MTLNNPEKGGFENILVTSIFSFSQNVFYQSLNRLQYFSHIYFAVSICFEIGLVQDLVVSNRVWSQIMW